jgi:hypothetical protein
MTKIVFKTAALRSELSDDEITTMVFAINPDVDHLKIVRLLGENPFLFVLKDGGTIEGTLTRVLEGAIELRQADGHPVLVLKSAVAAVRRPLIAEASTKGPTT